MFAAARLSTRRRAFFAGLIHRTYSWIEAVGVISPDDRRGRMFHSLGAGSCLSFPHGPLFGEAAISIGSQSLIGPNVGLSVGLPGEALAVGRDPVLRIGDRCSIGRGSTVTARVGVLIEDDVMTGPNVFITDHNHGYDDPEMPVGQQWVRSAPVRIGSGSWLGAGVVVLPGADIGRNVVVGANSVVRGTVPDHTVVAGAPARPLRSHRVGEGWVPPLTPNPEPAPSGWPTR